MLQKFLREILPHRIVPVLVLLLQLALLGVTLVTRSQASKITYAILYITSLIVSLSIVAKRDKGAFKLTWVFLILLLPLFGGFTYLMFNFQSTTRRFAKQIETEQKKQEGLYLLPEDRYADSVRALPEYRAHLHYLQRFTGFPAYGHTAARYLTPGESAYEAMLEALKNAKHYIFLEFFIVQEGVMWDGILEILKKKAAEGVTVRLIYDDLGCFFLLPPNYPKELRKYGIECAVFNPFRPFLTAKQNNRDHRKILVVDGEKQKVKQVQHFRRKLQQEFSIQDIFWGGY